MPENEIDANFYNLIHQLAIAADEDQGVERRGDRRQAFSTTQRIARRDGPGIPDESEFVEVQCHDLTRGGFSFYLPSRPDFDSLVAAFGRPPKLIYVAAHVSYCDDVLVSSFGLVERVKDRLGRTDREGPKIETATPMVLVGCAFTQRLNP